MKHILLFAAIALIGLASSCKKDPKPEELIVGKWQASHAFSGSTDVLVPSATNKTDLVVEFTADGKVSYIWTYTDLTSNPTSSTTATLNGVYSFNGAELSIAMTAGSDTRTVNGPLEITETHFLFTGTSGDLVGTISKIEADKI